MPRHSSLRSLRWSFALLLSFTTAAMAIEMVPIEHVGPQPKSKSDKMPRLVPLKPYAKVIHVAADGGEHKSVADALAAIKDASKTNRYAIVVAAGTYPGTGLQMKPWVDLYGGYAP